MTCVTKVDFPRQSEMELLRSILRISLYLALSSASFGDVITLKNGRRISAERTWEEGNRINYEIDGNVYGFSKDLVAKVESGDYIAENPRPEVAPDKHATKTIPIETGQGSDIWNLGTSVRRPEIIVDGKLDEDKLRSIERDAIRNPRDADKQTLYKNALLELVNFELKRGDQAGAIGSLQQYLSFDPNDLQGNLALAGLYLKQGRYSQAEDLLSQAEIKHSQSAELYALLGMSCYLQDKNDRARRTLRRSLDLKFSSEVDQLLKKIDGENLIESSFKQTDSLHFVIKYEGTEANQVLGRAILTTLEKSFVDLETALSYSPRESIAVILYTSETFRDVTRMPDWVGALNDGKIRLPIKGISRVDEGVSKILKHELTHSFVRFKTGGTCPVWLNEGLAQYLAGDSAQGLLPLFKRAISENQFLSLQRLEAPFVNLPSAAAIWAYQESLAAVEFLASNYGMEDLRRLLGQLGGSSNFEEALKRVLRTDYEGLEKQFEEYLLKR
jgi:tetratricopeptide (TPR) repeat protein